MDISKKISAVTYQEIAREARKKVLELIWRAQTSHIGSNFSVIDLMTVLFEKINLDQDKFILSAGWKAATLYYFLWRKGRINENELNSYCQPGSKWIGLAEPIHPDIPFAGGSMGMGLSSGVALAWSKKQRNEKGIIYVLESDGGMQVGINWEALWFADQHHLKNLVLIIDLNGLQAMGETRNILSMKMLEGKLRNFGWDTEKIDGHNFLEIEHALRRKHKKPLAIIARTTKGKGVSWMQDNNLFHYAHLTDRDHQKALGELNAGISKNPR